MTFNYRNVKKIFICAIYAVISDLNADNKYSGLGTLPARLGRACVSHLCVGGKEAVSGWKELAMNSFWTSACT